MKKVKLLLLIPALWTSLFDITITTVHQPKEYWSGNLQKANEGNPIGAIFMQNHVYGLFFISIIWILIIGLLGYYLPLKVSRVFLLFCIIAHSFGASSWLSNIYGFWVAMIFILFNSILYFIIEDKAYAAKIV
jgi:hypothetical protein